MFKELDDSMISGLINSQAIIDVDNRLEGKFYLGNDERNVRVLQKSNFKFVELGKISNVYNPPVFKRAFCSPKGKYSMPYFQSSDVAVIAPKPKFVNSKQAKKIGAITKSGQLLITGFGTIGDIRYVKENDIFDNACVANNVCRVEPLKLEEGYIYAFLASKYGKSQLNKNASGSVVRFIEAPGIKKTLIPLFQKEKISEINRLIEESVSLRIESNIQILSASEKVLSEAKLPELSEDDYESFGFHNFKRNPSAFTIKKNDLSIATINAFNYSSKIEKLKKIVSQRGSVILESVLDDKLFFHSSSFKRIEHQSPRSIKYLGQKELFTWEREGKYFARAFVSFDDRVQEGEILIAGVGTLADTELFCRVEYAGKDLANTCVAGEFIRMKTNPDWHPGYVFAWLNSEYGFRFIRSTHSGTKLCRPIKELLLEIPIPKAKKAIRNQIGQLINKAYENRVKASLLENKAIAKIDKEFAKWLD